MTPSYTNDEIDAEIERLKVIATGGPDKLAALFRKEGIKGLRDEPDKCPVARHLTAKFPKCLFDVGSEIEVNEKSGGQSWFYGTWPSGPLGYFIERFDDGDYSYLNENSEPTGEPD